jgi:hypothetical protein
MKILFVYPKDHAKIRFPVKEDEAREASVFIKICSYLCIH